MSIRRIVVYQKYATKPVILTDRSELNKEDIQKQILSILSSDKISILETSNDTLYIRPSEVQAILITNAIPENPESDTHPSAEVDPTKKSEKKYSKDLKLEKPQ